jgi:NAD-dependent deacetylase
VDPLEVATIEAFHRDPARFWSFYRPRFEALGDKRPNRAHEALVNLESRGLLEAVITQNVDRLHRKAGTRRLIEVHGSIETSSCTTCGTTWPLKQVEALFDEEGVAVCSACMGYVKPDVVLFGELLPEDAMGAAQELAAGAELLLCVGSSLEVYPVAGLPELTLGGGGELAILTKSATPYDDRAAVRMSGDVVEDLDAVLAALG